MKQFIAFFFICSVFFIPTGVHADVTTTFSFDGAEESVELLEGESVSIVTSFSGEVYATRLYICLQSAEVCDGSSYIKRFDVNATTTSFTKTWNANDSAGDDVAPGTYKAFARYYEYDISQNVVTATSSNTITVSESAPTSFFGSVVHGELTVEQGVSVYRSDFTSTSNYWTFNFNWPNDVPNSRALLAVLYTPEGESGYTDSSFTNQAFSSGTTSVAKAISLPALGGDSAPTGTYTAFVAEVESGNTFENTLLHFTSGGSEGTPAVASTTLTFTYTAEDQSEDLGSITELRHGGVTIEPNQVLPFDTLFSSSSYWTFESSWPNAVSNSSAILMILKGTPGNLDGGDAEEGVNYSYNNQSWSDGNISLVKSFGISGLASDDSDGTYTAILFEQNKKYSSATNDSLEWFFTDGESGRAPLRYRTLTFTLQREILECCSSVVFLPGLKGSVLKSGSDTLWPATIGSMFAFNNDMNQLAINPTTGESVQSVFVDGILESFYTTQIYSGFTSFMDSLVANTDDDINLTEWKAFPYDWRFSPDKILDDGVITSSGTTNIINEIKTLAGDSPTGQVTIVAHSMGGLLGKEVIKRLEAEGNASLIDSFVMVGTPQLGTPQAIASLLHGSDEGILGGLIVNASDVRQVAKNMQSAYNLLPSSKYFDEVATPPISFNESASFTQDWRDYWGLNLDVYLDFFSFATGGGVVRSAPSINALRTPEVLNPDLLTIANTLHSSLDAYDIPGSIRVVQVAGWGVPTTKTVEYKNIHFQPSYKLIPSIEGDKTVLYTSANYITEDERFFFNLKDHRLETLSKIQHRDLLSAIPIQNLLSLVIEEKPIVEIDFISTTRPSVSNVADQLLVRTNSPVILGVYDELGNFTGINPSQDLDSAVLFITEDIPGSSFVLSGDSQSIFLPVGGEYTFSYQSIGEGETTVEIGSFSNDAESITQTFSDIVTNISTSATFTVTVSGGVSIFVDYDGDGEADEVVVSDAVKAVQQAQVVATPPSNSISSGGGGGPLWNIPAPVIITAVTQNESPVSTNQSSNTTVAQVISSVSENGNEETVEASVVQKPQPTPEEVVAEKFISEEEPVKTVSTLQSQTATVVQSGWYDLFIKILEYLLSIINNIISFIKSLF